MAKDKAPKKVTKSDFLLKELDRNPDLDFDQVNRRWIKAGHPGTISNALFYQVRAKLGIKTMWVREVPPMPKAVEDHPTEVYQLKITLLDTKPPIWRRIQVGNVTLNRLHEDIQTAMGWTNSHMHHFRIDEVLYGDPMLMAETFEELNYRDSTTTRLSDILPQDGKQASFEYEYDFGDGWAHEVLFEGRLPAEPKKKYPLCLEGKRACPPEDCGGVWGYAEFVEAIKDPEHEQHDELLEWVGGKFDPEKFDPAAATRAMKKGLPDWRTM